MIFSCIKNKFNKSTTFVWIIDHQKFSKLKIRTFHVVSSFTLNLIKSHPFLLKSLIKVSPEYVYCICMYSKEYKVLESFLYYSYRILLWQRHIIFVLSWQPYILVFLFIQWFNLSLFHILINKMQKLVPKNEHIICLN